MAYLADDKNPRIRFVLYVSETQEQADKHVQAIATLLETIGIDRSVGKYGTSRGWRRNQLRTANGFNVAAIGLDTAARGVKLDEFRPDLMLFDDIDGGEDTPKTTAKKIRTITKGLIPAGAVLCVYLFIQNLISEHGIVGQMHDERADFLTSRETFMDVAVEGLQYESRRLENGRSHHFIIGGKATWVGQDLATCERQMNEWGLRAFLEEAQHEVIGAGGYFFANDLVEIVDEVPDLEAVGRYWDHAATQGGGDFTVGVLMGRSKNGVVWILDVVRVQVSAENLKTLMRLTKEWDLTRFKESKYRFKTPQDPGSAGKRAAEEDRKEFGATVEAVTGSKASRAKDYAAAWNAGNVRVLRDGFKRSEALDLFLEKMSQRTELDGKTSHWNSALLTEYRRFREDETHDYDDQVDAGSDGFNDLTKKLASYEDALGLMK